MRKLVLTTVFACFTLLLAAQNEKACYDKAMAKAAAGELEETISLLGKCISINPNEYMYWFNRGIARSKMCYFEDALVDFEQTIKLKPDYKNAYINRGVARKRLTNYEGAIADYSYCIQLDKNYGEAYYNRALVYELLGKQTLACADFKKALALNIVHAKSKVEDCRNPAGKAENIHPLLRLSKKAPDAKYGFTPEQPVKVGIGPSGGPDNLRTYIELLRDMQGKPVRYEPDRNCCPFQAKNGGIFRLDRFVLTYFDKAGKKQKATLYITFNDYEEPMVPYGFKTVQKK